MKRKKVTRLLAVLLSTVLCLQMSELSIAFATDEGGFDPESQINLIVPEILQDGNNYFFIREANFSISEKSTDSLYIPIQRTGDIGEAADVTLKVIDMSARYGENYKASLYEDRQKPEVIYEGLNVRDLFEHADEQEEVENLDENGLGEILQKNGGAQVVTPDGEPVGTLKAVPLDDEGNPLPEGTDGEEIQNAEDTEAFQSSQDNAVNAATGESGRADTLGDSVLDVLQDKVSDKGIKTTGDQSPQSVRMARNAFTGTISDRQKLEGGDGFLGKDPGEAVAAQQERQLTDEDLLEESYPGREFQVHFDPEQTVRFLMIDPIYSSMADGDCSVMLMLKGMPENASVPEEWNMRSVLITDEDAPEPVTISMAAEEIRAEGGVASVTVTRSGQLNNLVGVMLSSQDGSAVAGEDYGGVGAKLWFSMGMKERTIDLPVGHGVSDKDFTLTISPLSDGADVTIDQTSTHVVIPAVQAEASVQLMEEDDLYGDEWNLRDRHAFSTGNVKFDSDTAVSMETNKDKLETQYITLSTDMDYAWDGIHVEYDYHTWYSKGIVQVEKAEGNGEDWITLWSKNWADCSWKKDQRLDAYFGQTKAPRVVSIDNCTWETHNGFRDSHSDLWVKSVQPIRRNFTVKLQNTKGLSFEGMTEKQVLEQYQSVILDDSLETTKTYKTLDNFSVSRIGATEWARLTGLEAVKDDGTTRRLVNLDGKSSTATIQLSADTINTLARNDYINWKESNGSYSGTIIVRPVFDYVSDITVKVRETQEGTLQYNGKTLEEGTYTFHYGDKLTFKPNVSKEAADVGIRATGIGYESRSGGAAGVLTGKSDCEYYTDKGVTFTLTEDYYEFWQVFSDVENAIRVRVPHEDVQYFDTTKGLFAGLTPTENGGYSVYEFKTGVLTNDFIELLAFPKDGTHVPLWTIPNNGNTYSGSGFCFFAGVKAADNLVTLRIDQDESNHAWYSVSGLACTSTRNLSTGNDADDLFPAEGAMFTAVSTGAQSDVNGNFTMQPVYLQGGSNLRYAVSYNGNLSIQETGVAPANAAKTTVEEPALDGSYVQREVIPVSLGNVKVSSVSPTGAHFSGVSVKLNGFNADAIHAVEMSGKDLTFSVTVDPGQKYIFDGIEYDEHITDVTLYFQSQITGDVHGIYSTTLKDGETEPGLKWDAATNTATLEIMKFSPNAPEKYTWGDVVMLQLTTDKRVSAQEDPVMIYQPVSSGYAVITDQDYEPETFDYKLDIQAMLKDGLAEDEEGSEDTRYSFGKFPWLGEITAVICTFSYFASSGYNNTAQMILDDLELMEDNSQDAELMEGVLPRRWALSAAAVFKETPYGGVRTMIAVAGSFGNSQYSKTANPYRTFEEMQDYMMEGAHIGGKQLIYKEHTNSVSSKRNFIRSELGGPYIYFTVYVGIFIDWGFIEVAKTDGSGETEISHEAVFLGAGGFFGGKLTGGYTQYGFIPLPVYFNLEADIDITVFLGSSADPNKTLQSFYDTKDHKGQDFKFQLELLGEVGARLTIGAGYYKLVGLRATGGLGLQTGYSLRMSDWYPGLEGTDFVSYSTDAMFAGTIDLVVTSIDLYSASWPLPLGYGWLQYFQQMRRANALIHFINEGINDGDGSAEARAQCRIMADELGRYVDAYQGTGKALRKEVNRVQSYAYNNGIINWNEKNRVDMIRQGGLIGNIMETAMLTGDEETGSSLFHTRDHVDTRWVAGQNASLQAAFGPVSSEKIMDNAVSHPASQIMAIGEDQFLIVFLDDDNTRDRQQANVLKWTVYDANNNTWTPPATVQNDSTADGRANLIDAGDKLVLSWTSIAEDKYTALKAAVADELTEKNGSEPADEQIQAVLESDPSRVMAQMDIFSVEFTKSTKSFGDIEQLTDDAFYDDTPQAVYDEDTGDYIVLYYKTFQNEDMYANAEDSLMDLVSSNTDPEKTYSVLCYMLYNNQTSAKDTNGNTHHAGWARDYLFTKETAQDADGQAEFLRDYGGQRFLSSALPDNGQSDAPISDLTVCNGYNGLATFAFTVDNDYNVDTGEDKELFIQFYRFADHATYVPVKVAGEAEKVTVNSAQREKQENGSYKTTVPASITEAPAAVDVGQPKLIRNEGSTWLFWREDNDGLRYINISDMMNAKVETGEGDEDWTKAVQEDGSFAFDPSTGETWKPDVQKVDFGYAMTDEDMTITDYQVITDKNDNLYVVWTDIFTYDETNDEETISSPAQAIYATAKIKENDIKTAKDGNATANVASWSKPYRLTRDNSSNDGVTLALDEEGGLILVHNQYKLEMADTEQELEYMIDNHLAGIYEDEETGDNYFLGYPYYPSEMSLMVTRCESIGSVEATQFTFSDDTPVAGQEVEVTAVIENTGLTTAKAAKVDFYEYKDGRQGRKLETVNINESFPVNTAQTFTFQWTVPADGADGYSIQAVAREKKSDFFDNGDYDPVVTFSDVFSARPEYTLTMDSCVQNGDVFDVKYTVKNTGNQAVPDGVKANLCLEGLYGDLKDQYGMDTDLLVEKDISGLAPGEVRKVKKSITLPVSVFKFCGYDAVTVRVVDADGTILENTDHSFITLDEPLNLTMNEGKDITLMSGESAKAPTTYDSTVFMDLGGSNATKVVYSVDDPAIAAVDENGNVTGLGKGTTTLTATLLPSGRSTSIKVRVASDGSSGSGKASEGNNVILPANISFGSASSSAKQAKAGEKVTITVNPEEGYQTEAVHVTDADGNPVEVIDNGDGTYTFTMPDTAVTVTPIFIKEGETACPKDDTCPMTPFTDADKQEWYHDGVHWAIETGIMNGTGANSFEPLISTSRAMIVTMLWRMEGSPQIDGGMTFKDVPEGQWYTDAVKWAAANAIVTGYSEEEFGPMDDVTREQIVTILYRYAQFKGVDVSKGETVYLNNYTDARDIAEWAVKAFRWAVDGGVIQGMSETTLGPKRDAVRAEVATMLMRFKNLI